ncbi:TAXI family TRAP transporter solute-binding subunit [Amphritea balenae]|uniref:TAXI family TRAP transporter solute-binding subunit n=1 Tax=Amphritea balenae TaxID=452629 RepID=A0A3P1SK25_9GAMM|nr:TAXI family TRAP transporter solute-binding subunit [Amphritea balenae]RRC97498.1 TAXI family TRAP transporter solute-binding subunit [Amphritea balenae]GGK74603.1 C4-dicarboxylate ABC transporter substrate-binding protein [Amphritea balenae]
MALRINVTSMLVSLTLGLFNVGAIAAEPVKETVNIGTGGVTGVYYPTGGAICRLVNKSRSDHGIRCSTESTSGAMYNLENVNSGDLQFGVAQSDWVHHAYKGTSEFSTEGADKKLRVLFAMHPEPFTVVARADKAIKDFDDLKGLRVNIGDEGSGQRGTMEVLMRAKGWKKSDFAMASELKASEQASALCADKIDVMIYTIGHPSGAIKEVTTSCDSVLVNVAGKAVDKLVSENSYYQKALIPGGIYRGNDSATNTFGVGAIIVSSTDVSEETAYTVVKSVFDNFDIFRKLHPAFADLNKQNMANVNLDVPMHPGATKYFKEAGLID